MRRPKIIGLLVVPLFSFGLACCLPQKATAEEVRLIIGRIPVLCNTVSQRCYTPSPTPDGNVVWLYFSPISDIPEHQGNARRCQNLVGDLAPAAAAYYRCSLYGYSEEPYDRIS
jgi:hypothetical protein